MAQSDLFKQLRPEALREIDRITSMMNYPSGRIFYRPGEQGSLLFLLRAGRVQLYHLSTDGRKLVTAILEPGACFGEMVLIGQGTHQCFAEAVLDTRVYSIYKQDVEHLLAEQPTIAQALLQIVGQRRSQLETQLIDTTFKGVPTRLAGLLLQLARTTEAGLLVVEGFSQEELAERLGIYRETVSSALRDLKDAGAIEPGRKLITISNPTLLKHVASS